MANRIVTLKDDNNNPTFPIAGGMAEDSITTQMLKDGSVTSDKIDSANIPYSATLTLQSGITGTLSAASAYNITVISGIVRGTFAYNTDVVVCELPPEFGAPVGNVEVATISRASGGQMAASTVVVQSGVTKLIVNNRGANSSTWALVSVAFVKA